MPVPSRKHNHTTVNVADLDIARHSEVQKQLEDVSIEMDIAFSITLLKKMSSLVGIEPPQEFRCPAQVSPGGI